MDYQWKANGSSWRLGAVGQGLGRPGPGPWRRGQPGAGRQRRQGRRHFGVAQRMQRRQEGCHGVGSDGGEQGLLLEEETHPTTF